MRDGKSSANNLSDKIHKDSANKTTQLFEMTQSQNVKLKMNLLLLK